MELFDSGIYGPGKGMPRSKVCCFIWYLWRTSIFTTWLPLSQFYPYFHPPLWYVSITVKAIHKFAVTSVKFHPLDCSKVLTNGMDSKIKIIDIPSCKVMQEFCHKDFNTSYNWSSAVFSPNGKRFPYVLQCNSTCTYSPYLMLAIGLLFQIMSWFLLGVSRYCIGEFVASGSSSTGFVFVWNANDGKLVRMLEGAHQCAGVCGIVWGDEGAQSVDKTGKLVLWSWFLVSRAE